MEEIHPLPDQRRDDEIKYHGCVSAHDHGRASNDDGRDHDRELTRSGVLPGNAVNRAPFPPIHRRPWIKNKRSAQWKLPSLGQK